MDGKKVRSDLSLAGSLELVQKLVSYFVLAYLARHLDKAAMGEFFFAVAYATVFATLTQLGTGRYLMRRVAEDPDTALDHLGEVLSVRIPLVLATFLLMNAVAWLLMPDQILIVMLASIYVLTRDFYSSFAAMFTGLRLMNYRIATSLTAEVLLVALVIGSVKVGWQLEGILLCYIAANGSMLVLTVLIAALRFGRLQLAWSRAVWRRVVTPSLVFFIITFLDLLVFKVDTVMLRFMASATAVADYEAAYKFFEVSRVVVRPAAAVFFPIFAQIATQGDWLKFTGLYRQLVFKVGSLGAGISIAAALFAPILIPAVWGESYRESIPIMQVLFIAVPALYIAFLGIFLANSLYLERTLVKILLVSLLGNIALNSVAIPTWGATGAAWATVVTEAVLAGWILWVIAASLRQRHGVVERTETT